MDFSKLLLYIPGVIIFLVGSGLVRDWLRMRRSDLTSLADVVSCTHVVKKDKKDRDIFMSIKDDCRPYNPKEREEFLNPQDDSPKSISIRLFMAIVKATEYQLTLGINVFTVTI